MIARKYSQDDKLKVPMFTLPSALSQALASASPALLVGSQILLPVLHFELTNGFGDPPRFN